MCNFDKKGGLQMKLFLHFSLLCTILLCTSAVALQATEAPPEIAPPPPIPPKIDAEQPEPTVDIRTEEGRIIEEYRINGHVYMVKVTPENGVPFYYMDHDGDGRLELQPGDEGLDPVQPVFWKVKEWK
jgi:hypothetical protein